MALPLLLLTLGVSTVVAQAPPEPDANMDQPYSAQENPGQQPAYSQNQPYAQQTYPQAQPEAQQPYESSGPVSPAQAYQPTQPMDLVQLEQLVAPIAIYPDPLVALVLAAATYPAQIADADRWRQAQGNASSDQIAAGANVQNWDPSVKALTAFPQVLAELDANLQWTVALGNAYYNQPQDVLAAVQRMRYRAQDAGNLQSTPQQVVTYDQGNVQIVPANPEVVYVPAYNPWVVYGEPVSAYPGFSLFGTLASLGSSGVQFGLGMVMTGFSSSPWGWLGWGLDWLGQSLLFHQSNYYSHSTTVADWGLPHGGPRAFSGGRSMAYSPRGYGTTYGARNGAGSGFSREPASGFTGAQHGYTANPNRGYQTPAVGSNRPPLQTYNRLPAPARPQQYGRPGFDGRSGFGSGPYYGPGHVSSQGYGNRPVTPYNSSLQAYNRNPLPVSRPQAYGRSAYGSGSYGNSYYSRSGTSYAGRSSSPYASSPYGSPYANSGAYRAPSAGYERGSMGRSAMGNGFMQSPGKSSHSGGLHPFGGGHSSNDFYGGHQMKSFGGGKGFSEKSVGGHSGGFQSFGGGHSSHGGGHFGGHSSGGHRL